MSEMIIYICIVKNGQILSMLFLDLYLSKFQLTRSIRVLSRSILHQEELTQISVESQ